MSDTDTRTTLEGTISAALLSGKGTLRDAITAHVEAEVARRLAVAPSVEEAMYALVCVAFDNGVASTRDGPLPNEAGGRDARATLRAAIAADRERAVADARPAHRRHRSTARPAVTCDGCAALLRALGVEA